MTVPVIAADLYSGDRISDFAAAKAAGLELVILKASQGGSLRDSTYAARRDAARAAGLLVAAYHFSETTLLASVEAQVANFLAAVHPDGDDTLRLVLDWEEYPEGSGHFLSVDEAKRFLAAVDQATGKRTVVYASAGFLTARLGTTRDGELGSHPLWLAAYRNSALPPQPQPSWSSSILWQYTGDGVGGFPRSIAGIPGNSAGAVDLNTAPGMTAAQFRAAWLGNVASPDHPHDWAWIQSQLIAAGYDLGPTGADGDAGALTEAAIAAFIASHTKPNAAPAA